MENDERLDETPAYGGQKPKNRMKKRGGRIFVFAAILVLLCIGVPLATFYVIPQTKYDKAQKYIAQGNMRAAEKELAQLEGYRDSESLLQNVKKYAEAKVALENGEYKTAADKFHELDGFADSGERKKAPYYEYAKTCLENEDYDGAKTAFYRAGDYSDAKEYYNKCKYVLALSECNWESAEYYADSVKAKQKIEAFSYIATDVGNRLLFGGRGFTVKEAYFDNINGDNPFVILVAEQDGETLYSIDEYNPDRGTFSYFAYSANDDIWLKGLDYEPTDGDVHTDIRNAEREYLIYYFRTFSSIESDYVYAVNSAIEKGNIFGAMIYSAKGEQDGKD